VRVIDVEHLGRPRVIGCWQVGEVLIDPGPGSCVKTLLAALGDERPRALLLTHIHLDHAGASGALVRRWPDLEVYVHERGAPHVTDPDRLLSSAGRLYGEENMDRLWGDTLPVPEGNIRLLRGGEELDLAGGIRVGYTPGHASHHVAYFHEESRRAFVGDVGGVRIMPSRLAIAPTPPPDIDLEAWNESLELLARWRPTALGLTHFGLVEDVTAQLAAVRAHLVEWGSRARTLEQDDFIAQLRAHIRAHNDEETVAAFVQAVPLDHAYLGLERYWRKREEGRAA
jgi:glyoxylase-like metal-dependent hydrolase (beta-lactamase superfamily II)